MYCRNCGNEIDAAARFCPSCGQAVSENAPAASEILSGLAVASLIFGIAGWIFLPVIGPILALVFGYMARAEIRRRRNLGGGGMAAAGIVLGWIGTVIPLLIIILVALFFIIKQAMPRKAPMPQPPAVTLPAPPAPQL